MPFPRKSRFLVYLPSSLLSETHDLRSKTIKIGLVGRALSIFRVPRLYVFLDDKKFLGDAVLMKRILEYMVTPPYLRRRLFKISKSLRYVGLLPPLRIPSHPDVGEETPYREGVVVGYERGLGTLVDAGMGEPILLRGVRLEPGQRIVINVGGRKPKIAKRVPFYWGFEVSILRNLRSHLEKVKASEGEILIATSRLGTDVRDVVEDLSEAVNTCKRAHIFFGSPTAGLFDIARSMGFEIEETFDFTVNFAPNQGVKTVRTEEALYIVLGILNVLSRG